PWQSEVEWRMGRLFGIDRLGQKSAAARRCAVRRFSRKGRWLLWICEGTKSEENFGRDELGGGRGTGIQHSPALGNLSLVSGCTSCRSWNGFRTVHRSNSGSLMSE